MTAAGRAACARAYARPACRRVQTSASVAKAELLAAVFDAEIRRANGLSEQLADGATQRDYLDEMFAPGGLRIKLMRAGKVLPLR